MFFRGPNLARQELTFGSMKLQLEDQIVPPLPTVLRHQRGAGDQIVQRRGVGRGRLRALASGQVELCELLALVLRRHQRRAAVELVDDLEDRLVALFRWRVRREQPADRRCASARDASGISA